MPSKLLIEHIDQFSTKLIDHLLWLKFTRSRLANIMNNRDPNEIWRHAEDYRRTLPGGSLSISGLIKFMCFLLATDLALSKRYHPLIGFIAALMLLAMYFMPLINIKRCTVPTNAKEDKEFNQMQFIKIANNSKNVEKILKEKLNKNGVCYGLMKTWYLAIQNDLEDQYLESLDKIIRTKHINRANIVDAADLSIVALNFFQKTPRALSYLFEPNELEKYLLLQLNQRHFFTLNKKTFDRDLENIIKKSIQIAILNLGSLVSIILHITKESAHAVGIVAINKKNNLEIKFFDPNIRASTYTDPNSALKSIMNLLKYTYQYQHLSFWDNELSKIELLMYSTLFCSADEAPINLRQQPGNTWKTSCEWESKYDGCSLFSKKQLGNLKQWLDSEKQNGNTCAQSEWDKRWGLTCYSNVR